MKDKDIKLLYSFCNSRYKFYENKMTYDEFFSHASLGFVKALNKFDKNRGFKFSTYAFSCMDGEVRHQTYRNTWEYERDCRGGEDKYIRYRIDSLNAPTKESNGDDRETEKIEFVVQEEAEYSIEEILDVRNALSTIEENPAQALKMYYIEGKTQEEIADVLGITQVSVSRRLKKGLKLMKEKLEC